MNVVKNDKVRTIYLQTETREKLNILKDKLNITSNTQCMTFAINYLLKVIERNEKNKEK